MSIYTYYFKYGSEFSQMYTNTTIKSREHSTPKELSWCSFVLNAFTINWFRCLPFPAGNRNRTYCHESFVKFCTIFEKCINSCSVLSLQFWLLIQVAHIRLSKSRDSSTAHFESLGKNLFCAELSHLQNGRN